jgi:pilus assembly protein Flp/PilA
MSPSLHGTYVGGNLFMTRLFKRMKQLVTREEGVSMAEYALLLALIAIALTIAIISFRNEISNTFNTTTNRLQNANQQASGGTTSS